MHKSIALYFFCSLTTLITYGQQDTTATQNGMAQEDPSNFINRVTVFSELQRLQSGEFLNVTRVRSVIALGKKFTTRLDIPIVYNSTTVSNYDQFGIGDISIRLLGYKFLESRKGAMVASVEFSFNTAQSPLLGTGKNLIVPVISYSRFIPKQKTIIAFSFQQFYSLWGDESRNDIQWTKLQVYFIKAWSKKIWTLVLPEGYYDHIKGGVSMNLEAYVFYRLSSRFAYWVKGGSGLFGDHPARYQWTAETGLRYLMMRKPGTLIQKK